MSSNDIVHKRLEQRIQEIVSTMIVTRDIKHHNLSSFVSIKEVSLSKDKAYATLWVSSFVEHEALDASVEALNSAASFIQRRLGVLLKTKNTPKLTFKADTSFEEGLKVHQLIDSLTYSDDE